MSDTVDLLQIKIERAKERLPVETLNAIAAVDWRAAIMSIRQKKGYSFDQLGDLELETELLLCGLVSSNDYPKEIQRRFNISRAETEDLVNEMNNLVFKKIKEELIKNAERKKVFAQKKETQESLELEKIQASSVKNVEFSNETKVRPSKDDANPSAVLKSAGIEVVKTPAVTLNTDIIKENREDLLKKIEHPASTRIIEPTQGAPAPTSIVEPVQDEAQTPRAGDMHSMLKDKILGSVQVPIKKTEHTMENIDTSNSSIKKAPEIPSTAHQLPKKDPYRMSPDE